MSENSKDSLKISFSKRVKEELLEQMPKSRHCRIAEIAAMTAFSGGAFENPYISKKYFTLLSKTINITESVETLSLEGKDELKSLLKIPPDVSISEGMAPIDDRLLVQECCKKSYLRGAFLIAGSVNDPRKSYHLEIVSDREPLIQQVSGILKSFDITAKTTKRKANFVVYIKEGTLLVEALGLMGAPLSLMDFENVRILKDMRNDLNRKVNCETANIKKTVSAALSQIEDIDYIERSVGLKVMPKGLLEVAKMRRAYPEVSLSELGSLLTPPVGKSGVNHRLRRISEFASKLRKEEAGNEKGNCN